MDLDAAFDSSFGLAIDLTEREHSRDPHENRFEIRVDGRRVRYRGPYGEGTRGRFETETVAFDLTRRQQLRLRRELDTYDLRQSIDETFPPSEADFPPGATTVHEAPYRDVQAEAVVHDGESHEIDLSGVTDVRGQDTEMEHRWQARGLKTLCWQCKRWAEDAESGSWWNPFD